MPACKRTSPRALAVRFPAYNILKVTELHFGDRKQTGGGRGPGGRVGGGRPWQVGAVLCPLTAGLTETQACDKFLQNYVHTCKKLVKTQNKN